MALFFSLPSHATCKLFTFRAQRCCCCCKSSHQLFLGKLFMVPAFAGVAPEEQLLYACSFLCENKKVALCYHMFSVDLVFRGLHSMEIVSIFVLIWVWNVSFSGCIFIKFSKNLCSTETSKPWINPTSSRSNQTADKFEQQIPSHHPWSVTHITTHASTTYPRGGTQCLTGPITVRGQPLNRFHLSVSKNHLIIAIIPQRQLQSTRGALAVDGRDPARWCDGGCPPKNQTTCIRSVSCPAPTAHQYPDRSIGHMLVTCDRVSKYGQGPKARPDDDDVRVLLFGQKFIKILFIRFDRESFQMCRWVSSMLRGNHA